MALRLEVLDWKGPSRWRWRLTRSDGGAFLADHPVDLDPRDWRYEAFTDPYRYLRRHSDPDRRLASEAEICAQVGDWIGEQVLGPVAAALAVARTNVRLEVPLEAVALGYRPWELARMDGRALVARRVSFIIDQQPRRPLDKADIGKRLRMLAIFSLPEGARELNLRRERMALARLVHEIATVNGKGIELRVLQYGATRHQLEQVLLEHPGWDVVHLSGHGFAAGLQLEDDAGRRDLISSIELVDLLELGAESIKLVTLSACESAAITAGERLHQLLLPDAGDSSQKPGEDRPSAADGPPPLPAVATEVVSRLDCAVLAMRYPVVEGFAIDLAAAFYDLVLGKGQPVARALALALPRAVADPPTANAPALSAATPALFGARAADLQLIPPPGEPVVFQAETQKLAWFPPQPTRLVGRVGLLTRASTALAPRSGRSGVLLHGPAGLGKTACALELAYTHQASFARLVWHQAPPEDAGITTALTRLALDLERQIPGLKLVHAVADTQTLTAALPALAAFLQRERVLLVLDNLESLLTADGEWRDGRWQLLINALTGHGGLSRLVFTSRLPAVTLGSVMLLEEVRPLSKREAVLLARELPRLRKLVEATIPGPATEDAQALVAGVLTLAQGVPAVLEAADASATTPAALQRWLDDLQESSLSASDDGTASPRPKGG